MIKSFKSVPFAGNVSGSPYNYANSVPFIKDLSVKFTSGLNIVYGPNGSGKSTLIGSIAWWLAATQGTVSTATNHWFTEMFDYQKDSYKRKDLPFDVKHDGQPILYIDSRGRPGLVGGMAGFDYDFMDLGMMNTQMGRRSSGQQTISQIGPLLGYLAKGEENPIPDTFDFKVGDKRLAVAKKHLKNKLKKGVKTIILDEPDAGLSLVYQFGLWNNVLTNAKASEYQIIVATHSPFALGVKDANYIETEKDIVKKSQDALVNLGMDIMRNQLKKE